MLVMARAFTVLLVIALTGPSVGSLVCDWTCTAKHVRAPAAHGCHGDDDASEPGPAWAAGHQCHELGTPALSILSSAQHTPGLAGMPQAVSSDSRANPLDAQGASTWIGPPGLSHAPPALLIPLRV